MLKFSQFVAAIFFVSISSITIGQITKRALFIGNSYTAYNNLPQMISQCATSTGDQLIFDSNTPGGTTFQAHTTNSTTLTKIQIGDWDYVALQEQSQRPSFPDAQVAQEVFPYATTLDNLIKQYNPCAETVFYMTWGRKNGDSQNCASWPPVCTYVGMDSLLYLRYMQMTETNNASVSPVGALWRYLRENHPTLELYNPDESHPSYAGSYAAACSFYAVIFRKDPALITWNGTLTQQDAQIIRNAAKLVVFDDLEMWRVGMNDPDAAYTYNNPTTFEYNFLNQSENYENSTWFIDGVQVSTNQNFNHTFTVTGPYTVKLLVEECGRDSEYEETIIVGGLSITSVNDEVSLAYPNPAEQTLIIQNAANQKLLITDLSGQVLNTPCKVVDNAFFIDVSGLASGIYLLTVENKRIQFLKK